MMGSLRARLFVALAGAILITGLVAGGVAFQWAFDEAIELQDAVLLQVGTLAVHTRGPLEIPAQGGVDAEARVTIEALGGSPGDRPAGRPAFPANLPDGLQTLSRGGETWRVLVRSRGNGSRVAIAQPTSSRDEIAHESAIRTIVPLAVLFPLLMLLVGIIIRVSFGPVSKLAGRLDAKQSGHLEKLPLDHMPEELVPFVTSINRLLERIGEMFEQQRRFIAAAAHELRTPITALSLQAENLARIDVSREAAERLEVLQTGTRRIAHLLEQLLAASKYETQGGAPAPSTPFDPLVKGVVADHLALAETRRIDLGFSRVEPVSVRADATALTVLARNLIDNAIRHTPEGGTIDIDLAQEGADVRLRIEDTGPGIPADELDRVFEPFVRGSRTGGDGSGLGLSIVRSIVERANGTIAIENIEAPHTGLRVTVTFLAA